MELVERSAEVQESRRARYFDELSEWMIFCGRERRRSGLSERIDLGVCLCRLSSLIFNGPSASSIGPSALNTSLRSYLRSCLHAIVLVIQTRYDPECHKPQATMQSNGLMGNDEKLCGVMVNPAFLDALSMRCRAAEPSLISSGPSGTPD